MRVTLHSTRCCKEMERLPQDMLREVWWRLNLKEKDAFRGVCKATHSLFCCSKEEMRRTLLEASFSLSTAEKACPDITFPMLRVREYARCAVRLRNVLATKAAGSIASTRPAYAGRSISVDAQAISYLQKEQVVHRSAIERFNASSRTKSWVFLSPSLMEQTFKEDVVESLVSIVKIVTRDKHVRRDKKVKLCYILWRVLQCWENPRRLYSMIVPQHLRRASCADAHERIVQKLSYLTFPLSGDVRISVFFGVYPELRVHLPVYPD